MAREELELGDIQGLLLSGYQHLGHSRFLFLRFGPNAKADAARSWLSGLAGQVTTAAFRRGRRKERVALAGALQVAFTRQGLEALGLNEEALRTFSPEFHEGMAESSRSELLGDRGKSGPKTWEVGGPKKEVHALLMVYAADAAGLAAEAGKQGRRFRSAGLELVHTVESSQTPAEKEHFGFRDGISQPRIKGLDRVRSSSTNIVEAGEFVFGYRAENGRPPASPSVPSREDPCDLLPAARFKGWKDLGRNGSYLVFRKLSQDVRGFWSYFHRQAEAEPTHGAREALAVKLAAKCMGRWPSGAPLVLSPDRDDPELGADARRNNAFLFHGTDQHGSRCPIASHVRRANPRDSLTATFWPEATDPADSLRIANRHRILRRGRPYGKFLENPLSRRHAGDRGLAFFCVNTDLARQFEFIQRSWLNDPKFSGLANAGDPVAGDNDGVRDSEMSIPGCPVRHRLRGLPRFVEVRGGAYLFLPGIRALRFLARAA